MGKAIDFETREYAEDLYITRGNTLEQVAAATGVSISQIKAWSVDDSWGERKAEYRQAMRDIRSDTIRLRKDLIAKALLSKDPQDVYAAVALERVAVSAAKKAGAGADDAAAAPIEPLREISTPADAIAALQEAVSYKINLMLSRPGEISLAGIKDMKQAFGLLEEMQARYKPEEVKNQTEKGLSDEAADEIRRKILGLQG